MRLHEFLMKYRHENPLQFKQSSENNLNNNSKKQNKMK